MLLILSQSRLLLMQRATSSAISMAASRLMTVITITPNL